MVDYIGPSERTRGSVMGDFLVSGTLSVFQGSQVQVTMLTGKIP